MATAPGSEIDPKANILQRINWVQQQVDYVQREKKDGLDYAVVSHDKVTELVRPLLVQAGVVYYPVDLEYSQDGNRTQAKFDVRFASIRDPDDFINVATFGYGVDKQDKGPGKCISYGVKYALLKLLGLATGDDPDLDQSGEFNHRSSLDNRISELEDAIDASPDSVALSSLMNSGPTRAIMESAQVRNVGEFDRLRVKMSDRMRALKDAEKKAAPADVTAATGEASGEGAGLGGKA